MKFDKLDRREVRSTRMRKMWDETQEKKNDTFVIRLKELLNNVDDDFSSCNAEIRLY